MKSEELNDRRAKWFDLVEEQETSGLTQAVFCKERGVVLSQFVYYRGLMKGKAETSIVNTKSFTPVQVNKLESNTGNEIRLILPNGFQCIVPSRVEVLQIKQLVEALLSC